MPEDEAIAADHGSMAMSIYLYKGPGTQADRSERVRMHSPLPRGLKSIPKAKMSMICRRRSTRPNPPRQNESKQWREPREGREEADVADTKSGVGNRTKNPFRPPAPPTNRGQF